METAIDAKVRIRAWVCDAGHLHVRSKTPGGEWREDVRDADAAPEWLKSMCRDDIGRFAPCGGQATGAKPEHGVGRTAQDRTATAKARMAKAHDMVKAIRDGGKAPTAEQTKGLHDHLGSMTVSQLHELRKAYGLKASGNKADLRAKIAARLKANGQTAAQRPASGPAAKPDAKPDAVPPGTYGPSKGKFKDSYQEHKAGLYVASVLGPNAKAQDLLSITGVPHGATAAVSQPSSGVPGRTRVRIEFRGQHTYKDPEDGVTKTGQYEGTRTINRDANGTVHIHNDYFRGEGMGLEMFGRQVENATQHGVSYIDTHAAGSYVAGPDPNKSYGTFNGYTTWPKFGYDAKVPDYQYGKLSGALKEAVDKAGGNIRGLMASKEGQTWWLKNGSDLYDAKFDLTPGSYHQRTLTDYLTKKGILK